MTAYHEYQSPHSFNAVRDELQRRTASPPNHLLQLVSGPRQVGKTTLLFQLRDAWRGRVVYASADVPAAALPGWWENVWAQVEQSTDAAPGLVLVDEVHYLSDWSLLLKTKIDEIKRRRLPIHVIATSSSALAVGRGGRESMAGRFERLRLLHWQADAISATFGTDPEAAAHDVVRLGAYPGTIQFQSDPDRWRAYVRDSIVEPAVGRDLLALEQVRRPGLLRQVFAVAVGHPAEVVSLQKIAGQLQNPGALETIAHYLQLLEEACLVAALPKYSGAVVRRRSAPPKLVTLSNALLSSAIDTEPPSPQGQPAAWGRWVENACIACAWGHGQSVSYWREEPAEVDMVTTGSWGNWAVEVKTGRLGLPVLRGVLEFCRRNPEFRPALVCDPGQEQVGENAGIVATSWQTYLHRGLLPALPQH